MNQREHERLADRRFRTLLAALRSECPIAYGTTVRVRRIKKLNEDHGHAAYSERNRVMHISIYLNVIDRISKEPRKATWGEVAETLIHEWAHAMSWVPHEHHNLTDHDAIFGVNYAKAYAAVVED